MGPIMGDFLSNRHIRSLKPQLKNLTLGRREGCREGLKPPSPAPQTPKILFTKVENL